MASGLTIGRDIMGTMANTLMLAYIGGSLSLTVLLIAYSSSVLSLFNREMIVVEVLQALAGSFAILLTIPLTSLIAGVLYTGKIKFKMEGLKIPPKEKII
ncbi:MAG: YibE/F family protein, partial [Oscillospiraceae bacterium]